MKAPRAKNKFLFIPNIIYVLLLGFFFRIFISNFGTLQLDHGTYVAWGNSLFIGGLKNFYNSWSDYLPGYLYVLYFLGKLNSIYPEYQTLIFKLPAIIADLVTGYLIYRILKEKKNKKVGEIGAILYIFNPAIFANSTLWGQVDSLTSVFSMLSLYIFPYSGLASAFSLAIGTLIKPQAAFILPAILYLFIVYKKKLLDLMIYGLFGMSIFVIGFIPFNNQSSLINFILNRLYLSSNQYPYGSVNAFSYWGMFGFWKPDGNIMVTGIVVSIAISLLVLFLVLFKKIQNGEYLIATTSFLATFLFLTRIHERHLLPVFAPLLISSMERPALFISYLSLSVTYLANLYYAYIYIVDNFRSVYNNFLIKFLIIINMLNVPLIVASIYKDIKIKLNLRFNNQKENIKNNFVLKDIAPKYTKIFFFLIILFSLITRLYSLGSIKEMYFDEIYHAFTAKLVLHNDPKAWEFWNPNPDGFAYEWTHPPLSKLGMVVGMVVFGENSFGWRFPQAVLGVLSIYMIFLIAKFIFKDSLLALLSAFTFSLDGLPLVLSRMGMNDSYVLFFSLLSVYLFISASENKTTSIINFVKDRVFWSSIAFGLALSSKWSAIYTLPIIFVSHFVFRRKDKSLFSGIKISYFSFLIVPVLIYILSYSVMFATGHSWTNFVDTQKQMWWYHTGLVATHPYTSPAWSWPLLLRPIYLYDGPQEIINNSNTVARIYAFGNPLVFWFGLFSIIVSFLISFFEKNRKLAFILFSYLIFFLPWIMSPRIMFLYHYLPSIPFMSISIGYVLRKYPKITPIYLFLCIGIFIYFYPHWAGLRIPESLDTSYYWFSSWR